MTTQENKVMTNFEKRRLLRKRRMSLYQSIFPNLFTTGNLFCGFYSIIMSLKGNYVVAAYLILIANIFDMVDGRVARMLNATSLFGKEYDSLADLVSFGVAPAVMAYLWAFWGFSRLGWLVAFLFVACGALRLARYNVMATGQQAPVNYFLGLPIPAAGSGVATFFLFYNELHLDFNKTLILLIMMFLFAYLMVSRVKYPNFKKAKKPTETHHDAFRRMVYVVLIICVIAMNPEASLFVILGSYILFGILRYVWLLIFKRRDVLPTAEIHK